MTGTVLLVTVITSLAAGITVGVIGLVTLNVRREERYQTLIRPVEDSVTRAVRRVNGVYVRDQDTTPAPRRQRLLNHLPRVGAGQVAPDHSVEAARDFPRAG
jgi:MFS superfamily sulfate permease-like transporter